MASFALIYHPKAHNQIGGQSNGSKLVVHRQKERAPMPEDLNKAMEPLEEILRELDEARVPKRESTAKVISRLSRQNGIYPAPNLAVEVCDRRFAEAMKEALSEGKSDKIAKLSGKIAFCTAMPKLSGASNIRDFIACVTYAMSLDIIPGNEGTRLLYAAQVAHMALTKRPKKRGKSSHTSTATSTASHEE
jgi:hypothetical protein